jgi:beta-glucanase (GH16 family)
MAFFIAAVLALLLAAPTAASAACSARAAAAAAAAPAPGTWQIVWEDDFSGATLNESNWTPSNYSQIISQYDGHSALFIADRVTVSDGALVITTMYDPRTLDGVAYNFTSGWVDSQHKRNMTRGRYEASMRMPVGNATGAWPAWWLLPEGACWCVAAPPLTPAAFWKRGVAAPCGIY